MNIKNREDISSFFKFTGVLYLIYYLGMIKGILFVYLLNTLFHAIIKVFLGLEPLEYGDWNFVGDDRIYNYNMLACTRIEKINMQLMKENIIERCLKHFDRLSKRLVFRFNSFYWERASIDEAIKRIRIIEDSDVKNKDDLIKYAEEWMKDVFPINTIQWEVRIIKLKDSNDGLILFKFDHSYSDGISLISFELMQSDNYSLDMFPQLKTPSILQKTLVYLLAPFYIPLCLKYLYFTKKSKSPFKSKSKLSGEKLYYWSDPLSFNKLHKVCRHLNVTFNDLIITISGKVFKKICNDVGVNSIDYIDGIIPINIRVMPKHTKDFVMSNETSFSPIKIPIHDDVVKEAKAVSKKISKFTRNFFLFSSFNLLNKLTLIMPRFFAKFVNRRTSTKFDVVISNVPGPKHPMYFRDLKVTELLPIPNTGYHSAFIGMVTYNGELVISATLDNSIGISAKELIMSYEREIKYLINEFKDF